MSNFFKNRNKIKTWNKQKRKKVGKKNYKKEWKKMKQTKGNTIKRFLFFFKPKTDFKKKKQNRKQTKKEKNL